jgi:hypothetical protein
LQPVHIGHHDVGQHHVEPLRGGDIERNPPALCLDDEIAGRAERSSDGAPQLGQIVDAEYVCETSRIGIEPMVENELLLTSPNEWPAL